MVLVLYHISTWTVFCSLSFILIVCCLADLCNLSSYSIPCQHKLKDHFDNLQVKAYFGNKTSRGSSLLWLFILLLARVINVLSDLIAMNELNVSCP